MKLLKTIDHEEPKIRVVYILATIGHSATHFSFHEGDQTVEAACEAAQRWGKSTGRKWEVRVSTYNGENLIKTEIYGEQ